MNYILRILIFSFFLTSCGSSDNGNIDDPQLQVRLVLRDTFSQESDRFVQGENIEFLITLTNNTDEAITLNFNNGQQYDFYILSSDIEIWRWSDGMGFIGALTEFVINGGESIEVNEIWNQALSGGETISIGSYTSFGSFLDQSSVAQFSFTIQ